MSFTRRIKDLRPLLRMVGFASGSSDLLPLSSCPQLEQLSFSPEKGDDEDSLRSVETLSLLRSLSIDISARGVFSSFNPLIDLPNLQHLTIAGKDNGHNKRTVIGMSTFLPALESLILNGVWVSNPTTFQSLSQHCEQLSVITLSSCQGVGLDFTLLTRCKALRRIELRNCQDHMLDLLPLASCAPLRELHLTECDIGGMSCLAGCTQLESLWVIKCVSVDDLASLDHLRQRGIVKEFQPWSTPYPVLTCCSRTVGRGPRNYY